MLLWLGPGIPQIRQNRIFVFDMIHASPSYPAAHPKCDILPVFPFSRFLSFGHSFAKFRMIRIMVRTAAMVKDGHASMPLPQCGIQSNGIEARMSRVDFHFPEIASRLHEGHRCEKHNLARNLPRTASHSFFSSGRRQTPAHEPESAQSPIGRGSYRLHSQSRDGSPNLVRSAR